MLIGFARGILAKAGDRHAGRDSPRWCWHGRPDAKTLPFRMFPAHAVPLLPAAWFKDKFVLIGEVVSLTDRHRTPFASIHGGNEGNLAGIEIHANAVSQLLHQVPARNPGLAAEIVLVLAMAGIGAVLGAAKLWLVARGVITVLVFAALWIGGFALFHFLRHLHRPDQSDHRRRTVALGHRHDHGAPGPAPARVHPVRVLALRVAKSRRSARQRSHPAHARRRNPGDVVPLHRSRRLHDAVGEGRFARAGADAQRLSRRRLRRHPGARRDRGQVHRRCGLRHLQRAGRPARPCRARACGARWRSTGSRKPSAPNSTPRGSRWA